MLLLGSSGTGSHGEGEIAKAVDFDGTNDYLSRASDFTGNADGKTFTFSAWVWRTGIDQIEIYSTQGSTFVCQAAANGTLDFALRNASNVVICQFALASAETIPLRTFSHFLVSIDLSNVSKRHAYVDDAVPAGLSWITHTNDSIDFTKSNHYINANASGVNPGQGRLSHVFLDYTYRDLSIEANRRLFITADRKPAQGQAALNPILYLPMDDPSTAHINQGTGGNFTLNGTIARSGRGPNQFNAPYSDLDGAADYLSRTTVPTGFTDGNKFTVAFTINLDSVASDPFLIYLSNGGGNGGLWIRRSLSRLQVVAFNSAGTTILNTSSADPSLFVGRNLTVAMSVDLSQTTTRHFYINGLPTTTGWNTYNTAGTINFSSANASRIGEGIDGRLGNVFFDTSYIDLSVPANLAKFVTGTGIDAKPADLGANGELPFGTAPLIYLPMYGNNAGKNYGTGGDFTVNSGPYPGARGPTEFWGNKADFDGSTGYLSRTSALTGVSDGKTVSGVFFVTLDTTAEHTLFQIAPNSGNKRFGISTSASNVISIVAANSANTSILLTTTGGTLTAGVTYCVMFSIDLSDTGKRFIYIDGTAQSPTWTTYSNDNMQLSAPRPNIGVNWNGAAYNTYLNGKLSEFYFTTEYIDFSQEANRLLFRDAFGNPTDLPAAIAKGTVPNPAIYMRFDPANQGLNSGTGGDFTKSGTITDGGQL